MSEYKDFVHKPVIAPRQPLTSKRAVEFLLEGTLKLKVCKYCLNVNPTLTDLDQFLKVTGEAGFYKVTIKDMVACFYPYQVVADSNLPDKVCEDCLDHIVSCYLFTQQIERADRALKNCFAEVTERVHKLDPLVRPTTRGRKKANPNTNKIIVSHKRVIDYADPLISLVNQGTDMEKLDETKANELECPKCWQEFNNVEALLNHKKTHPNTMWFYCKFCGLSFAKENFYRKHLNTAHSYQMGAVNKSPTSNLFKCKECGIVSENYSTQLEHVEKHKFKGVMEAVLDKKLDQMCSICFEKGKKMVEMDSTVHFHGGYPGLRGRQNLYNVMDSSLPTMITSDVYIGTKICETCLDQIIAIYTFVEQIKFFKIRLSTCIQSMINHLKQIDDPISNIFIEVAPNTILPKIEDIFDSDLDIFIKSDPDEEDYKMIVLEDEFRIEESSTDSEDSRNKLMKYDKKDDSFMMEDEPLENLARHNIKTYSKKKKVNDVVNEIGNVKFEETKTEEQNHVEKKKTLKKNRKHNCTLCGKHFISEYFLIRHMKSHISKKVECRVCGKILTSKFSLREHRKMSHLLNKSYYLSCVVCLRSFADESKLVRHMELHRSYDCILCGKLFKSSRHYGTHIERHVSKLNLTIKNRVNCSFCEKEYKSAEQLDLHVNKTHLQMKPYGCDMCDGQFYARKNMVRHKLVHSIRSRESCGICGEVLSSRVKLIVHIRMHFGAKPHKCGMCSEFFFSVRTLNLHLNKVHGGRYHCKLCNGGFRFKSDLKFHVQNSHVSCL